MDRRRSRWDAGQIRRLEGADEEDRMTEFRVEAVRVGEVTKHPNADSLSITNVYGGYPCIIKTGYFAQGDLAVYVPVDALAPVAKPQFAFLDSGRGRTHERIRARKLRGIFSMGLLVKAPDGVVEGQDCRDLFGIEKWEPEAEKEAPEPKFNTTRKSRMRESATFERIVSWATDVALSLSMVCAIASVLGYLPDWVWYFGFSPPFLFGSEWLMKRWNRKRNESPNYPTYDIEGIRRYMHLLSAGDQVSITEKIHGCNGSFLHTGKRFWAKSRTLFRNDPGNVWRLAAEKYGLEAKLKGYPNVVLFGEVYGEVQDLKYGVPTSERVRLACFDAMDLSTRQFMNVDEFHSFCKAIDVPTVPELYRGPWHQGLLGMAEGQTTMPGASHVREGVVIKPLVERRDPRIGRVIVKLAGQGYLLRKEAQS
jgi:tRNA-binding EMAP/Myf-like protein